MNEKLELKLKELPERPGIYEMLNKEGRIIYIGKSKSLRRRVRSYFVPSPAWEKAKEMQHFIEDIRITVTDTHLEAMLLECERIKKIKPYFNAMMKNDQRYLYLTLEESFRKNPLKITNMRKEDSFGPFRRRGQIQEMVDQMRNLYPIRKNKRGYDWEYHIFPASLEKEVFEENQIVLQELFSEQIAMELFAQALEEEMKKAASQQKFERAGWYHDLYRQFKTCSRALLRCKEFAQKTVLYRVPLEDGYKFFYILDGIVIWKEKVEFDNEKTRSEFLKKAETYARCFVENRTEKERMDYQEIVYGELLEESNNILIVEKG